MPHWNQVSFSDLELKGLWIRATGGDTSADALMDEAAERAVQKIYRAEKGMNPQIRSHCAAI